MGPFRQYSLPYQKKYIFISQENKVLHHLQITHPYAMFVCDDIQFEYNLSQHIHFVYKMCQNE